MKKVMHVQEILMVRWLQLLLFMIEPEQCRNILHHYWGKNRRAQQFYC